LQRAAMISPARQQEGRYARVGSGQLRLPFASITTSRQSRNSSELPWPENTSTSRWRAGSCCSGVSCLSQADPGGVYMPQVVPCGITSEATPHSSSFSNSSCGVATCSRQPRGSSRTGTPFGQRRGSSVSLK
jgi:hypothetical protein